MTWKNTRILIFKPNLNSATAIIAAAIIPLMAPRAGMKPSWNFAEINKITSNPSRKIANKIKLKIPKPAFLWPCSKTLAKESSISPFMARLCLVIQINIHVNITMAAKLKTPSSNGSKTGDNSGLLWLTLCINQLNKAPTMPLRASPPPMPANTQRFK